jgi:hypothetical protein
VQSTIPDMAKYASALLRRGAGIVRPATFDAMIAPQHLTDRRLTSWALSFARSPLPVSTEGPGSWRTFIGHGGAYFGGWNSHIDVLPDEGVGIVQHMNIMIDEPGPIFRSVLRAALGVEHGRHEERAVDESLLNSAPGVYELPMPGPLTNFRPQTRVGRVHIERDGHGLRLTSRWGAWKGGAAMTPCDPDDPTFFAVQPPDARASYLALVRGRDGRVAGLMIDDLVFMHRRTDA